MTREQAPVPTDRSAIFDDADPHAQMLDIVLSGMRNQVVAWAARLGLADHLAADPRTADDVAAAEGLDPDATFRLLRLLSEALVGEAVQRIDTRGARRAVDVGGGTGTLVQALMQAHPDLRGIVLDTADVARGAEQQAAGRGLEDWFEAVAGDFLISVPAGDLLLLKFILHDWPEQACRTILENCRRALAPDGRLVVVELVLGDDVPTPFAATHDLGMLTVLGGRERTGAQYRALLAQAGFRLVRVTGTTSTPYSILEAELDPTHPSSSLVESLDEVTSR